MYKESTYQTRYARVVNNEDDKTDNNRKLIITVQAMLPILAGDYIDRITGTNASDYGQLDNTDTNSPTDTKSNKNFIVDPEDDGRYSFIGVSQSLISKVFVHLYYDSKFNDILVIPDLYTIGTEDNNVDLYKNRTVQMIAFSVGMGSLASVTQRDLILPLITDDISGIPKPKKADSTTTIRAIGAGLSYNTLYMRSQESVGDYGISTNTVLPIQYIVLPKNSDLYDTVPPMNTYNVIQETPDKLRLDYVGMNVLDKIVIPINF